MKTQRFFTYVTAAALAAGTFGIAGCKDDPAAKTADNRSAGEKVADADKKASEKIGQGVDATTERAIVGLLISYTAGYQIELLGLRLGGGGLEQVVPFVILVLILLIKPYGLFGEVRIERV